QFALDLEYAVKGRVRGIFDGQGRVYRDLLAQVGQGTCAVDDPAVSLLAAGDDLEQGGFPGAVSPDERDLLARPDTEGHPVEENAVTEMEADVFQCKHDSECGLSGSTGLFGGAKRRKIPGSAPKPGRYAQGQLRLTASGTCAITP